MTNQSTNPQHRSLCALIADDSYASGFQTMAQYRAALLRHAASHPNVGAVTNNQIAAGAAVKCECGKPLGRNVAIDVHDAIERANPYATGGIVPAELFLVGEGLRPLTSPARQAASPGYECSTHCDELGAWGGWYPATAAEYEQRKDDLSYRFREVRGQHAAAPSASDTPEAPKGGA